MWALSKLNQSTASMKILNHLLHSEMLVTCSIGLLVKLIAFSQSQNSLSVMGPERYLPCSQEPATGINQWQMYSVHSHRFYFFKTYLNIILLSPPRSSKQSVPFRVSDKYFVYISHYACYMSCPYHPLLFNGPNKVKYNMK